MRAEGDDGQQVGIEAATEGLACVSVRARTRCTADGSPVARFGRLFWS